MTKVEILPISAALLPELSRMHSKAFHTAWDVNSLQELLSGGAQGIVLQNSDVKQTLAFLMWRKAADEAEILTLVTMPEHCRKGYACMLLTEMLNIMRESQLKRVFLEVRDDNAAAEGLYKQQGFTGCGKRKAYYPMADGTRRDAVIMEYRL